jgi:hypothetical protein
MLSELGRPEEALTAAQEAADLYRGLTRRGPSLSDVSGASGAILYNGTYARA